MKVDLYDAFHPAFLLIGVLQSLEQERCLVACLGRLPYRDRVLGAETLAQMFASLR